jgi:uncharacterized integral membrane protein (TIGR00697 family)
MTEVNLISKKHTVFLVLAAFFITNVVVAEMIGSKIFSLEQTLGIEAITFISDGGFSLPAGAILWPSIFIITDLVNEYFGPKGVKKISILAVGCVLFAFLMIAMATKLSPAPFWLEINKTDSEGRPFDVDYAYTSVFTQSLGIIIGSVVAFFIGQLLDASIFAWIKSKTSDKFIWLRANGSTFFSQMIDSFVVLFIAFYIFGGDKKWSISQIFITGLNTFCYKILMAILLTPLLYLVHRWIDGYLGLRK